MSDKLETIRVSMGKVGGDFNGIRLDFYFTNSIDVHCIFKADADKHDVVRTLDSLIGLMTKKQR